MREIKLHSYQKQALCSDKRIVAMIAGLQSGKTFSGALWMRMLISQYKDPYDSFIVAFPTYSIYTSSTLPAFMRLCSDLGTLNKSEHTFTLNHGPVVYFRSMDNDWSAEGITNCRAIWIDEGGLISTQAFINLMGRAAPKQAQIFVSTTPYNLSNYLYRDIYEPWRDGTRDDVEVVQFKSVDNPYFPKEEYERQQSLLDPRMFRMRYCGEFERMAGLVYSDFDYRNYTDSFKIDSHKYTIVAGIDWGYTDPFAIAVRAIDHEGTHDYQIGEYCVAGHTPNECVNVAKQYQRVYGIERFYADCADPGMIAEFQKASLPVVACKNKNIEYGIGLHNSIIRSQVYQVFRGKCPETEREYESYQYKKFDIDGQSATNMPLDINNHLMDANRYVTVETQHLRDKAFTPYTTTQTHLQKLLSGGFKVKSSLDDWYEN
jgi:PBSX family phage terminase large subunit